MSSARRQGASRRIGLWIATVMTTVSCAVQPPPPDWKLDAKGALDRAMQAQLAGDARIATLELEHARTQIARTARIDLMARAELAFCAAQLASLDFAACDAFEAFRADASIGDRAYADFLQGRLDQPSIALLPEQHRAIADHGRGATGDPNLLATMTDPLSRLVAAAVWLRTGRANPGVMAVAIDTASAQGWRRPLLAWLTLQEQSAAQAGDRPTQERSARRIQLLVGRAAASR